MFVIFRNEVVKFSVDFRCLPDDAEFRGGLLLDFKSTAPVHYYRVIIPLKENYTKELQDRC